METVRQVQWHSRNAIFFFSVFIYFIIIIIIIIDVSLILQFRALSDQLYKSPEYHKHVRKDIVKQVGWIWKAKCMGDWLTDE